MNSYVRMNQCNAHACVVQLYKNNAHPLLLHIFNIANSDWLQHVQSPWTISRIWNLLIIPESTLGTFLENTFRKWNRMGNEKQTNIKTDYRFYFLLTCHCHIMHLFQNIMSTTTTTSITSNVNVTNLSLQTATKNLLTKQVAYFVCMFWYK